MYRYSKRTHLATTIAFAAMAFANDSLAQSSLGSTEMEAPRRSIFMGGGGGGVVAIPDGPAPDEPTGPVFGLADSDPTIAGGILIADDGSTAPTPTVDPLSLAPSLLPEPVSFYVPGEDTHPDGLPYPLEPAGFYTGTWTDAMDRFGMPDELTRVGKIGVNLTAREINGRRIFFASISDAGCDGVRLVREYQGTYLYDPAAGEVALTFFDARGRVSGRAKLAVAAFSSPIVLRARFEICDRVVDATMTHSL